MTEKHRGASATMTDEAVKTGDATETTEEAARAAQAAEAAGSPAKNTPASLVGPYWTMEEY